ncbi:MAG: hypothetical protein ACRD9R_07885 [Pyrinomonadaceae bacterium]
MTRSTIARLRAGTGCGLLGEGYCHRAGRAVKANLVAVFTSVAFIGGVRVGLVRRARFGATCEEAVAKICADLPESLEPRLLSVDARIATVTQFEQATERAALVGR